MVAPATYFTSKLLNLAERKDTDGLPNVIVIVFDAWSAANVSLYGYPRETMPNLEKFAERATVYHNHYTAGTFTVPGTSSLLTGLHPWTHRAFQLGGRISQKHAAHQIFSTVKPVYQTLGFTQNMFADQLLYQADEYLDTHVRIGKFHIQNRLFYNYFKKDARMAFAAFENNIFAGFKSYDSSLFLGPLFSFGTMYDEHLLENIYQQQYAGGMPVATEIYLFKDVVDGAIGLLENIQSPGLMYLHFYPPHEPYTPKRTFFRKFEKDGLKPTYKKNHKLTVDGYGFDTSVAYRRHYDEYLASWDDEFGRVFEYLEKSGLLENSYVIVTSDHGEMFERGEIGHITPLIYEPLIHIPLVISRPGQSQREDIHTNTSSVDILPTLAHLTGRPIPDQSEGQLLPGFDGTVDPSRSIFAMDAKNNSSFARLDKFSISLTRDRYRLTYYKYPRYKNFEFYDLDSDPDELLDLFPMKPSAANDMRNELEDKIADINRPYKS